MGMVTMDRRAKIPNINRVKQVIRAFFPDHDCDERLLLRLARFTTEHVREHAGAVWSPDVCRRLLQPLLEPGPRPLINATGIMLHTNMGRAPLQASVVQQALARVAGYTDLELDAASAKRGHRDRHIAALARLLWPVEDATLVNNAAAAVCLALSALARDRETVVSRGELIEIGGSFRLPDVMTQAGTHLREVGTTNKTRIADFEAAVGPRTGCLFKAHPSNYRIEGFTHEVPLHELTALGRRTGVPVVYDLGGGYSEHLALPAADEPSIEAALAAEPDLLIFSCDKLLGGVQAGLVLGRADLIAQLRRQTLMRMLRTDKLTLSIVCHQLAHVQRGLATPTSRLANQDPAQLERRAAALNSLLGPAWRLVPDETYIGGGSLPAQARPGTALAYDGADKQKLADCLRRGEPGLLASIRGGLLRLNLATVFPEQDETVAKLVIAAQSKVV
ncbi:L-seryl-tRNA(Sec) selenium transferase [Acanthopleuribacter pedis]